MRERVATPALSGESSRPVPVYALVAARGGAPIVAEPAEEQISLVVIPRRRGRRRWVGGLVGALVVVLIGFLALPLVLRAAGHRTLVVTSGSMEPTAATGDAIVLKRQTAHEISVGDVISFHPLRSAGVVTHRVASVHDIEGQGIHYRTKGDGNADFDPNLVPAGNVLGKVVHVAPRVGYAYAFASSLLGRLLLVGIPALAIIAMEVRGLWRRGSAPRRKPKARTAGRIRPRPAIVLRAGTAAAVTLATLVLTVPATAQYVETASVGGNVLSSSRVNPPTLTNAIARTIPCRVDLTWNHPTSGLTPAGYEIYRSTTSGGPYSLRGQVGGSQTSFSDSTGTINALTSYHYVVRSTRAGWTSVNSNQLSVTITLCLF